MLKYSVKLGNNSIQQEKMVWSEKYLSPDLSFISGITSPNCHLEKYSVLPVSNSFYSNHNSTVLVESENVMRQGYAIIKNKEYEVQSGSIIDYSSHDSGDTIDYKYLFINGKYYYLRNNEFVIPKWLSATTSGVSEVINTITYDPNIPKTCSSDTIVWIENGVVNIDGNDYFFDKDVQIDSLTKGGLKYYEDGQCLPYSSITKCSDIKFNLFNENIETTKFVLRKDSDIIGEPFERITFCTSYYYVKYKDNYYSVIESGNTNGEYHFICRIPKNKIYNTTENEYVEFMVSYDIDGVSSVISNENFNKHNVHDLHDLYKVDSFIKIDNTIFYVSRDIMNSNDGRQIAIYLDNQQNTIGIGDKIILTDESSINPTQYIYGDDERFIIYNSEKYKVIDNLCDKVSINGNEYVIDYINGKVEDKDCLVLIGDEEVPMKITKNASGLTRYGNIIVSGNSASTEVTYDIIPYDGVIIDGKKYIASDDGYVDLDKSNKFTFVVSDIRGNSMLICDLDINSTDFNDSFRTFITEQTCRYVVENQETIHLMVKNKVFGDKEITNGLPFQVTTEPISSDDYYNLLDDLDIYTRNAYIELPMMLSAPQGNNLLQDDQVKKEFFEVERKKAINPIIDMEKDVYYPKFIVGGEYNGANTDFITLEELKFNLHFRTRNMTSWKVNEGYNDISTSGNGDNWFVTDFHPYCDILKKRNDNYTDEDVKKIENSSDLLYFLYFTNDDVYYQKQKIAKSFLRLSFYDSIDPQTQNLLATSTVFMDEHKLFKKFIDNSRKYVNDFGLCEKYGNGIKGTTSNKISVMTEYLGSRKKTKGDVTKYITEFGGVIIDDDHRLGSELIVKNKYQTESSSEGFYIYMFKEYSENLHPKPIYMKVEFNHAGIGRTIPFVIPMRWSNKDENGNKTPVKPLSLTSSSDVKLLKEGVKLGDVYAQSYIPLYAVYDFKNKQYAYVFDDRYVQTNMSDNKESVILNLYELKIMDENTSTENEQKDITYRKQETAIIDINTNMFPSRETQITT